MLYSRRNQMMTGSGRSEMKIAVTATPDTPESAPFLFQGDVGRAFHLAAQLDCQGVELHLRRAADVDARSVKKWMTDYRLAVPTLGTGMAAAIDGLTFSDSDDSVRARAVQRVGEHVRLAAELGSAVIIGLIRGRLGAPRDDRRHARRAWALDCLARVCRAAEALDVTMLIEPLNRYECDYIKTVADGSEIVAEIGAANLKLLADTFHMSIEEPDPVESLLAAASLLGHVHLADTNRQAPGHGHLDIVRVLRALRAAGYAGYLSLEVLPLPNAEQAVRDAVAAIRAAEKDVATA